MENKERNLDVHFSSKSSEWETPQHIYDTLNKKYKFTLDPCATDKNHKCDKWYTKEQDGLLKDWSGEVCFVNPPYGTELGKWVKKAYNEYLKGATVVMLIPARTDTRYFHDYIYNIAKIEFIKGRISFLQEGKKLNSAPFPSMIVVFKKEKRGFFSKWW